MLVGTFTFYNEDDLMVLQLETLLAICDAVVMLSDNATEKCLQIAEAYEDNEKIYLLRNIKEDNFNERDEVGDRQKLLDKARSIGATQCLHTDVDEIFSIKSIPVLTRYLTTHPEDVVLCAYRYDLWDNAHTYRLDREGDTAGEVLLMATPPVVYPYIFPVRDGNNYILKPVPNFHSPRIPLQHLLELGKEKHPSVLHPELEILHYGYYRRDLIETKGNFYKTNEQITQNCWGEDMQVTSEEFIKRWGMGEYTRK